MVRGTLVNDQLTNVQEIFVAQTRGAPGHFGSRLVFDGKGYLYVSVGDRQVPPTGNLPAHPAQDPPAEAQRPQGAAGSIAAARAASGARALAMAL
ncbi:MAG: PQQ-dependent sugar dehydrogenase, partial [bacterium]